MPAPANGPPFDSVSDSDPPDDLNYDDDGRLTHDEASRIYRSERGIEPPSDCELCGEPLTPLDDEVFHRECILREVMGGIGHLIAHEYWCLEHHDPDAGLTYRQSALLCDAFVSVIGVDEAARRSR